ncbi:DUF1016 N-terminal domain-containing protein [Microbacterium protaetiae]|uniref:DUF1016 N-terminal domain-containing protein n=1 Tax=Microbacterium protaetiae TaxID=2509458 RepID=UPI001A92CC50
MVEHRADNPHSQEQAAWGDKILTRLAADLRTEFPSMKGFSLTNLKYMRRFAATWSEPNPLGQRPVDQVPWGQVIDLITKLDDQQRRDWYAAKSAFHGWSRRFHDLRHANGTLRPRR